MPHNDPVELVHHAIDLILANDLDAWAALCHRDGVVEFPFAPAGMPTRLDGPAAVAAYVRPLADRIHYAAVPELEIRRTDDPETVVVEMRATGEIIPSGSPYDMRYIAVVTVRDGRFLRYREYWNPLTLTESTGVIA